MSSSSQAAFVKHSLVPGPQTHRQKLSTLAERRNGVEWDTSTQETWKLEERVLGGQTAQAQIPAPPSTKPVTLSNSPTLTEPQLPPLENGIIALQTGPRGCTE